MPKYKYLYIRVTFNRKSNPNLLVAMAITAKIEKWEKFPLMGCIYWVQQNCKDVKGDTIIVHNYIEISKEDFDAFNKEFPMKSV